MDRLREAEWYIEAGRPDDALRALRDADPREPRVFWIRGCALFEMGKYAEAEEVVRDGLRIEPQSVQLLDLLAWIELVRDPNAAEVTLRKALALDAENPRSLGLYVMLLMQQDRLEWAGKMLDRLLSIAPEAELTQCARTIFLLRASDHAAGLDAARTLLANYPDEAYAHWLQGLALLQGPWWRGLRHLRQAAVLRPQDPILAETARVMQSWYLWPVHLTSGPVHYPSLVAVAVIAAVLAPEEHRWLWYAAVAAFAFIGYKWLAAFVARHELSRRVTRALRHMYG